MVSSQGRERETGVLCLFLFLQGTNPIMRAQPLMSSSKPNGLTKTLSPNTITSGAKTSTSEFCCCSSVTKSHLILCDPMDCSTPGSCVLHYLPEFAQIPVHWVSDCYLTVSSSVVPFSFYLQSFPASGSFPMRSGKSTGASASVLPMNIQGWLPLRRMVDSPCIQILGCHNSVHCNLQEGYNLSYFCVYKKKKATQQPFIIPHESVGWLGSSIDLGYAWLGSSGLGLFTCLVASWLCADPGCPWPCKWRRSMVLILQKDSLDMASDT